MWLRGGTYYARFRVNGRLHRDKLSTDFQAACELLRDLRARADRADFGLVDNDYGWNKLRAEFLKLKRQTTRNPIEYERDLNRLEEFSRVQSIRQIDESYVIGFRAWMIEKGKSPRTINKQVGTLSNMLNVAVSRKLIGSNPIAGIKPLRNDTPSKQRRSLTLAEVEALFAASPPYLRRVWRMFMVSGIRKAELVNMRFTDVDFERRIVTVTAGTAKNHKAREIPLDDETVELLKELRAEAKQRQPVQGKTAKATEQQKAKFTREHVFVTKANTPFRNNLLERFYAKCKRAKIEGAERRGSVDIHSLRVTFTTLSLEHGASPKAIQTILGHSTLALTMGVYARATDRTKREAIGLLPFAGKMSAPDHAVEFPVQTAHKARTSIVDKSQVVAVS